MKYKRPVDYLKTLIVVCVIAILLWPFIAPHFPFIVMIGIISVVVWYTYKHEIMSLFNNTKGESPMRVAKLASTTVIAIAVGVLCIVVAAKSIVIVGPGETGVVHLFGKVSDAELSSGLHIINPFAHLTRMSIRTEEYTMTIAYEEGQHADSDAITALTKEGLNVDLDITVFYHLVESKASDVFRDLGEDYEEKIIRPEIRSSIRSVVAQYEAKAIYSEKREDASIGILKSLKEKIEPRGIVIEDSLLRNVNLPAKLTQSIQDKLAAEQDAERMVFVLQKEQKEAERKRVEARGQRDAQQIINQSLTDKYLAFLYIQSLKDRQGTIYVPVNPENGLPFFQSLP